jgi:hypothetical protein
VQALALSVASGCAINTKRWESPLLSLRMRLYVRRPTNIEHLVSAWAELGDQTRSLLEDGASVPHTYLVRLGCDLGNGEWSGSWSHANMSKVVRSYSDWAGGTFTWAVGNVDLWGKRNGPPLTVRATFDSDDPDFVRGTAEFCCEANDSVAESVEVLWLRFFEMVAGDVDLIYAEIAPRFEMRESRTTWEQKSGVRPSYNGMYLEGGEQLRGCGWVTWLPDRLTSVLPLEVITASGVFYRSIPVEGRGVVLCATTRAHGYTEAKELEVEALLRPVLR